MRSSEFITEATLDLDQDVNQIYDTYFKPIIDDIHNEIWDGKMTESEFGTDTLKSPICVRADEVNPCIIRVNNMSGSFYRPHQQIISININSNAISLIQDYGFDDAYDLVLKGNGKDIAASFANDVTAQRVKGTIAHEIAHWVRDSLGNKHIRNEIDKAIAGKKRGLTPRGKHINSSNIEIDSQIHSLEQTKKRYERHPEIWDSMTFDDALQKSGVRPALGDIPVDQRNEFIQTLKKRMHREGLLGKNMR